MRTVKIADVLVEDRQRQEFGPKDLDELKRSIASSRGLLHAPVLSFGEAGPRLVAGERRLRAMQKLHEEGLEFTHDGEPVPLWHMPYTTVTELSTLDLAEAELEENLLRCNLTWQEESFALKKIHELRLEQNPQQTLSATANEIIEKSGKQSERTADGKASVRSERKAIADSLIVADHLDDPMVKRARSRAEAVRVVLDKFEDKVKAQSVLKQMNATLNPHHKVIHGDSLDELKKLPSGIVDTIISDPPYGMKADKMGKGEYHMYDDSPETALEVCKAIIAEGFRITKSKAIMFMFCDIDHFVTLRTFAQQQAWSVWRAPIVWRKGTDGHSPWGRAGFIRTTELLLFAVKGQKELVYPGGPDVLDFKRPSRGERVHAAEKPIALLDYLIHISTLPGQTILDPTAGSGPIISAAQRKQCKVIAIEKDRTHYEQCLQRLEGTFEEPTDDDSSSDLLD